MTRKNPRNSSVCREREERPTVDTRRHLDQIAQKAGCTELLSRVGPRAPEPSNQRYSQARCMKVIRRFPANEPSPDASYSRPAPEASVPRCSLAKAEITARWLMPNPRVQQGALVHQVGDHAADHEQSDVGQAVEEKRQAHLPARPADLQHQPTQHQHLRSLGQGLRRV